MHVVDNIYLNTHSSLDFQIHLTPTQTFERVEIECSAPFDRGEIGCSTPYSRVILTPQSKMASNTNQWVAPTQETPCSQFGVLPIRTLSSAVSSQTGLMDIAEFTEV